MNILHSIFIAVALVLSFPSFLKASPSQYVMCKNSGSVRTIRIESKKESNGCVVQYSKSGRDEVVGSGITTTGCMGIVDRVKRNLQKHWWKCKDVKNVTFVDSASQPSNVN